MAVPESAASASESRSERKSGPCGYCGADLPEKSRPDRKHCNDHCRRMAYGAKIHQGRVRSVNLLKNGMTSVTYHIKETNRRPGDIVAED